VLEQLNTAVSANIGLIVLAVAALAVTALLIAVSMKAGIRTISGRFSWIQKESGDGPDSLATLLTAVQDNKLSILRLESDLADTVEESHTHFKHVGLVRFDAFDGVAGQQSYSLCLLDERGNGVIVSSLVGNNFSRGYAVEVRSGEASRKLGDEESNALTVALQGTRAA